MEIKKRIRNNLTSLLPGRKPDFIIVGAQKSATSSLHNYLNQHPQILGSRPKEVRFFDRDDNYKKGVNWYHSNFRNIKKIFGITRSFEATPEYLYRSYSAAKIYDYNPQMKIIIVLREPIKRAYSSWNMYFNKFKEFKANGKKFPHFFYINYLEDRENNFIKWFHGENFPTFEESVQYEFDILKKKEGVIFEEPSFVRRGIYYPQIKRFVDLFGWERIKIFGFRELISDKKKVLNEILKFIQLPECDWGFLKDKEKFSKGYTQTLLPESELQLKDFYKTYNEELFKYLGSQINW